MVPQDEKSKLTHTATSGGITQFKRICFIRFTFMERFYFAKSILIVRNCVGDQRRTRYTPVATCWPASFVPSHVVTYLPDSKSPAVMVLIFWPRISNT